MSVYSGRQHRQLYDPELAMYHFQHTEGKAISVRPPKTWSTALLAFFLVLLAGTCTSIAIYLFALNDLG
jgi:hypothetical protein